MARVFDAVHKKTGLPVAVKLLDEASRESVQLTELRERMAREAVLLASLQSPHVSQLLGYGWDGTQPFLVLERLLGETLADVLRRDGRLTMAQLVDWIEQLLVGVRDCHREHIIHRDIKPANIFLARTSERAEPVLKLIDFGLARLARIAAEDQVSGELGLTSTYHVIGSMGYMAPEQLESARSAGPAADLYAVGVVVFRCVTGRLPFVERGLAALTRLKCEATAPRISSLPGVVPNELLDAFVARALSRAPDQRFSCAGEMLEQWWRVGAALDREAPIPRIDVVFTDDEWGSTLVELVPPGEAQRASPSETQPVAPAFALDAADGALQELDTPLDLEEQHTTERQLQSARSIFETPPESS
jgi:serine/threonine-protein kinase